MKYYLIAGEASGDLHASRVMRQIKLLDPHAEFRFFGGDMMAAEGGVCVRHFREIAYMGFVPVLMHLPTILEARRQCREDILSWQPDRVVLVDYAGFNLPMAKFLKKRTMMPVVYYIPPKAWAWKEGRVRQLRRYVDRTLCILPFEKDFFEGKHGCRADYVGNPTANEVDEFRANYRESCREFFFRQGVTLPEGDTPPVLALLAGSRKQEIKDNLPMMLRATNHLRHRYIRVLAGAPSIEDSEYAPYIAGTDVTLVRNQTFALLSHAAAALVTSGTATLETCCFGVPQVVVYKTPLPRLARWVWNNLFSVKYISLVNLIADREVVSEMMADKFNCELIAAELDAVLPGGRLRDKMLEDYAEVRKRLGDTIAPDNAARHIVMLPDTV